MPQLYALHQEKKMYLKLHGYEYVEMWEHDWVKLLKTNDVVIDFVKTLSIHPRLDPREAFFGGRTNATNISCITKLLPMKRYATWTLRLCIPLSTRKMYIQLALLKSLPIISTSMSKTISELSNAKFCHLVVCITPCCHASQTVNSNLLFVVPVAKKKRKKSVTMKIEACWVHGPRLSYTKPLMWDILYSRYMRGIIGMRQRSLQFEPSTGKGGLFSWYVNTFLKFKQESSGWPDGCDTDDQKSTSIYNRILRMRVCN